MTLSEELTWRGFLDQTTFKDIKVVDHGGLSFYWGVDPSADSMTVGNLAIAMLVKHFMQAGHKAVLLVGGATGFIGDPDGKASERDLITAEALANNKQAIVSQYQTLFNGEQFDIVDNFDWFKNITYLEFLREVGKHVPMRQMLGREFIQTRLGESGSGISYAEFSYVLIQAYDYLTLFKDKNVTLQIAGSDQWGNCIAGVELIRRISQANVNVWTAPLITNQSTGVKFGKTEDGAIWLDPNKTTPTAFYQFWINTDDEAVEKLLKIYTLLPKDELEKVIAEHQNAPSHRIAQKTLAFNVTAFVHGEAQAKLAEAVTSYLTNERDIGSANDQELDSIRKEIASVNKPTDLSIVNVLVSAGLAKSNTEARSLVDGGAIYVKGQSYKDNELKPDDFESGRLLIRRGKAFKDSALIEI